MVRSSRLKWLSRCQRAGPWFCRPDSAPQHTTHHRSGFLGFFRRDFSRMALALVNCPTFSSSLDSKSHRGMEWGHFFSCLKTNQETRTKLKTPREKKPLSFLHPPPEEFRRETKIIKSLKYLLVHLRERSQLLLCPKQLGAPTLFELPQ